MPTFLIYWLLGLDDIKKDGKRNQKKKTQDFHTIVSIDII